MRLARLFSTQASAPVVTLSFQPKSTEASDSFGSDFLRLGLAAPNTSRSAGSAWRTYPERSRDTLCGTSRVTFETWRRSMSNNIQQFQRLTAFSDDARKPLDSWRSAYLAGANATRAFEDERHDVLLRASRGETLGDAPRLGRYDTQTYRVQAQAIDELSQLASRRADTGEAAPESPHARRAHAIRKRTAELRDTMYAATATSLSNTLAQIKYDRRDLFLLNEMTREAERERANGGAQVPLRLAIRADKCALKPAKSRSRLTAPTQRARREAANLAMLIGLAPGTPVTLDTLRARGFGRHENTVILNDAKSDCVMGGDCASFLFNRIREMEVATQNASDTLARMAGHREIGVRDLSAAQALVGDDLDEQTSLTSADLSVSLTSVRRRASLHSDDSYQREPAIDDVASLHSTPEPERSRALARQGSTDALPTSFGLERMPRHHRVADDVIPEEEENDESSTAPSIPSSPSPHTARGNRTRLDVYGRRIATRELGNHHDGYGNDWKLAA